MGTQNETKMDALLYSIADEANDAIDYSAMLDAIRKKAAARKRMTAFIKYGSMAAAFIVLTAIGSIWLRVSGANDANSNECAPQEACMDVSMDTVSDVAENGIDGATIENETVAASEDASRSAVTSGDIESNELYSASGAPESKEANDLSSSMAYIEYYMLGTIQIPNIDFGTGVEAVDGNNLSYRVYGCTEEDMESYLLSIAELHNAEYDTESMCVTLDDGSVISLTLVDGTMTIAIEN